MAHEDGLVHLMHYRTGAPNAPQDWCT